MINRRYAAPPPALGGSTNFITIGKTGERVVTSDVLKADMRAYDFEQIVW